MLYVCATPIGNLDDVTARVLETLRAVELIAAEDTRRTRKLLARYDIHTPTTSLFAHNEAEKTAYVLGLLAAGATSPWSPTRACRASPTRACAWSPPPPPPVCPDRAAGSVRAGHRGGRLGPRRRRGFRFVGYLPRRATDLRTAWDGWRRCGGLIVAFETGPRLARSLAALADLAPAAQGAVCRELTKVHEEVARGTLVELAARFATDVKGEITLVIDAGPPAGADAGSGERARAAAAALRLPVSRGATPPPPSPSASASGATRPSAASTTRRPD